MCGRYVVVSTVELIEKRFHVSAPELPFAPTYNLSIGAMAPVITSEQPSKLQFFQFGMTPHWAKKKMYLFNARAEGDANKENNPDYTGGKMIINKPSFRKPIRSQRCLVIADAFIEGTTTEGLSKPYVVYLRNRQRPFAMAGIYDHWVDPENGNDVYSFSIITTTANSLLQKLPHHRSPVILHEQEEKTWLHAEHLNDIMSMLKPYPSEEMNAYPISAEIKNPGANHRSLLDPVGERLVMESEIHIHDELKLTGMGSRKNKNH